MLSPKNNSKLSKLNFIRLAFEQAKINLGSTGNNPSVGCVVEKNGAVISAGCTSINGRPHAESNALSKNYDFKNSNIYVSLEPCSHYGNTPPCTNIIIKKKIKKVFFSYLDKDPRSEGKSLDKLKKKNIFVQKNVNGKYGKLFYESYLYNKKRQLPFLDAKIALSKDYFTKNTSTKWITNSKSRRLAHLIRSKYNCIISSSKSINDDNSQLNCRIKGLENRSPNIAIIDRNLNLKKKLKILQNKKSKIYLFTCSKNNSKKLFFKRRGVKVIQIKNTSTIKDFKKIFVILNKLGNSRILLESGLNLLNFFLKGKMINNIYVFKNHKNLYKKGINYASPNILKKMKLKNNKINVYLNGDKLYKIRLKNV